jgi:hypothetical protein
MAVDNPTVVQEASTASHEWKNVNAQVSALLASILQRVQKGQEQNEEQDKDQKEGQEKEEGQDKPKAKDKPRSVEIQVGKTKVFKGIEGQEPQKNTLTPAQVSALQKLVDTPSTEAGQNLDSSVQNLGRVVTVRVDKEPVLRVSNGQIDNKLAPEPQQERTPEPQLEAITQPQKERAVPEFVNTSQSSARFPEIPADFGIEAAKGINADDVAASGDGLFARSYLNLETIRQDLNDSYRRGSEPGFEFIANAPHVAPLRERFEAEKTNFEFRLNNAIEQGKYNIPEAKASEQTTPQPTAPEQTQPEPLEPLGHHQPLGQQESLQTENTHIQVENQPEPEATQAEAQAELVSEEQQPGAETTVEEIATKPTHEPVTETPVSETQAEVEEPGSEPKPEAITTESKTEIEQQPEPTPKRSLGEIISKDLANSFELPPETKEYFRETGTAIKEGAKAAWAKFMVKAKATAIAGVNQAKTQLHSRQAANTAVQLLNSDPQGRSFKGEDYNITAINRHTISITDAEQKEILRFEETPLGPKILKSELTPKQLKEFAQVRGQLQKHGTENLLNIQPTARMQFLQGFAPQGDRAEVQKLHNNSTISRVEQISKTLKPTQTTRNTETHELGDYAIKRQGDNLEVVHRERGAVLTRSNGQVQGNLSDRDIAHFKGLSNQVSALLVQTEPEKTPVAAAKASTTKTTNPSSKPEIDMGD